MLNLFNLLFLLHICVHTDTHIHIYMFFNIIYNNITKQNLFGVIYFTNFYFSIFLQILKNKILNKSREKDLYLIICNGATMHRSYISTKYTLDYLYLSGVRCFSVSPRVSGIPLPVRAEVFLSSAGNIRHPDACPS